MGGKHIIPLISYILPLDQQFEQEYSIILEGLTLGRRLDTRQATNAAETASRQDDKVGDAGELGLLQVSVLSHGAPSAE